MRIQRTGEEWTTIIEQQKESGQTVTGFCREKGIHVNVFYRKQKQLPDDNQRFVKVGFPEKVAIGRTLPFGTPNYFRYSL